MQKEAAVTQCEHDLAGPDVVERAIGDFDLIARPKTGQHAFPGDFHSNAHPHAHLPGHSNGQTQGLRHALEQTTAATQNICDHIREHSGAFRAATQTGRTNSIFEHQEEIRVTAVYYTDFRVPIMTWLQSDERKSAFSIK
jgi:hypothetical protein